MFCSVFVWFVFFYLSVFFFSSLFFSFHLQERADEEMAKKSERIKEKNGLNEVNECEEELSLLNAFLRI